MKQAAGARFAESMAASAVGGPVIQNTMNGGAFAMYELHERAKKWNGLKHRTRGVSASS